MTGQRPTRDGEVGAQRPPAPSLPASPPAHTIFHPGSRSRLTYRDLDRFPGETLSARFAREVAKAGCLPRKELLETWEVARRVRRRLRGGRVVDLACGHGLLAFALLLLDRTSAEAVAVDRRIPASAGRLLAALATAWPEVAARVRLVEAPLDSVPLQAGDLVVAAHACGRLTDRVLERAAAARARVGVLPCCTPIDRHAPTGLEGWLGDALAVDVARAARLERDGYAVHAHAIPEAITPKNRLLIGWPRDPRDEVGYRDSVDPGRTQAAGKDEGRE